MRIGKLNEDRGCAIDSVESREDIEKNEQDGDDLNIENIEQNKNHYHVEDLRSVFKALYERSDRKTELDPQSPAGSDAEEGSKNNPDITNERGLLQKQAGYMRVDVDILERMTRARSSRYYEAYISDLDRSTPLELPSSDTEHLPEVTDQDLSDDELQYIWENDPGYVNPVATKKFEGESDPDHLREVIDDDSLYMRTGFLRGGFENWGSYYDSDVGEPEIITLQSGHRLQRYGAEDGGFFTDPGTNFSDLHLNKTVDKLEHHLYEVIKSFPVEKSFIGEQPFDNQEIKNDEERVIQYRSMICAEDLVDLGYLRRL